MSGQGITADPSRVDVIKKMKATTKKREVRRFLGMASYYRNYIQGFGKIAEPLSRFVGKGMRF